MPKNPQLFNLDDETIEVIKDQPNKSKYVREAIKFYEQFKDSDGTIKPEPSKLKVTRVIA